MSVVGQSRSFSSAVGQSRSFPSVVAATPPSGAPVLGIASVAVGGEISRCVVVCVIGGVCLVVTCPGGSVGLNSAKK